MENYRWKDRHILKGCNTQCFPLGHELDPCFLVFVSKFSEMGKHCVQNRQKRKPVINNSGRGNVNRLFSPSRADTESSLCSETGTPTHRAGSCMSLPSCPHPVCVTLLTSTRGKSFLCICFSSILFALFWGHMFKRMRKKPCESSIREKQ